jgi:hypothetical protein
MEQATPSLPAGGNRPLNATTGRLWNVSGEVARQSALLVG